MGNTCWGGSSSWELVAVEEAAAAGEGDPEDLEDLEGPEG